jgi:hypothetical protein
MNRTLSHVLIAAALGTVALAGCKKKEAATVTPPASPATVAAPAPAPMPTASVSVSGVDLGTSVGTDMKVGAPTTTFKPGDTIIAAVSTSTSDATANVPGKLGVKWTHVDSNQTVHEESKDVNFSGAGVTDFQISKPDGWPAGKYRVEVSLDGNVVQTRDFEVK